MSIDDFETVGHDINMLAVATDELEYDLSLIEYFDGEMQLEEFKSKIEAMKDRHTKIEDEIGDLEDEISETKTKIDLLENNIKERLNRA